MSNVVEALDFRAGLVGWLNALAHFFCKDVEALPDASIGVSPGGVAKSPARIAAEVVSMCNWAAEALRGAAAPASEGDMEPLLPQYNDKAEIVAAVRAAAGNLGAAIGEASDETLATVVTPPWQQTAPLATIAQIAVNHIWYHDGQLNYLQAIQGDGNVHWRD